MLTNVVTQRRGTDIYPSLMRHGGFEPSLALAIGERSGEYQTKMLEDPTAACTPTERHDRPQLERERD